MTPDDPHVTIALTYFELPEIHEVLLSYSLEQLLSAISSPRIRHDNIWDLWCTKWFYSSFSPNWSGSECAHL